MAEKDLHLDELELEAARTGEADAALLEHLSGCAVCRERQALWLALATGLAAPNRLAVPPEREAETLRQATEAAARGRSSLRRWAPLAGAVAAAAAALLVALWPAAPGGDVNGDGVVDIVDALALSRMIERGEAAAWDLNGDGQVDARDVDAVAGAAVALGGAR